jgi:alpha-1,3-glucan synthase
MEQDNANETAFEHDLMQTQLRGGGDVMGLIDSLDYIQGIGAKAVYLAGSAMINLPWESDGELMMADEGLRDGNANTIC